MKKVIVLVFVGLVILVPAFLFWGCASEDGCSTEYYIKFTVNGQEYSLNSGTPQIDENTPAITVSPNEDTIYTQNGTCGSADQMQLSIEFYGWLYPDTPGEYIGTYSQTGSDDGLSNIYLMISEPFPDQSSYFQSGGTFTITTFGDVGGIVEGTFDVTWVSSAPAPSFGSPMTTVGEFRLLRVSDEYFQSP